ncbi:MAG: siphovirus Gp157 family protein [Prevotellaceae bacterium]|nr:siphovirus Gp157 family protein [Prevotellaceae bacterium]
MKLFEIDEAIENCLNIETGEFDEEMYNLLTAEREQKIENLICYYKNVVADAEALKTQEKIFKERKEREERKAESLKQFISRALNGEKFKTDKVEVGFRKSKQVVISDDFIEWAQRNSRDDLLTYKEPTANKTAIKAAITDGEELPAEIVENLNISIK